MNLNDYKVWYAQQSLRWRVHHRIVMKMVRFEDWLCMQPDWLSGHDVLYQQDGVLGRMLCLVLGHSPIPDQCNIPEHDYCSSCSKAMPRAATREQS